MNAHNFIFGSKIEDTVTHIINEACRVNTREAFEKAIHQIDGIRLLMHHISGSGGVPMPTAFLMIGNELSNLRRIIDSPLGCLPKKAKV